MSRHVSTATIATLMAIALITMPSATSGQTYSPLGDIVSDFGELSESLGELNDFAGGVEDGVNTGMDVRDQLDSFLNFSPEDAGLEPDLDPAGQPQIPTHCGIAEGLEGECQACYETAYRDLNHVRRTFERLRAIHSATENYTENMIAFGNTAAGAMGVGGMPWHYEKVEIEKSFESFKRTYNETYRGLLGTLERSLKAIADCEVQYYGENNWYSRFGFIYYNFMADRYSIE